MAEKNLPVFVEPNEPHALFTFSTTSAGGQNAVYDLSGAYGRTIESIEVPGRAAPFGLLLR